MPCGAFPLLPFPHPGPAPPHGGAAKCHSGKGRGGVRRAGDVLTTGRVSACFGHPVRIARTDGRWTVRAERVTGTVV
ncbi:hypothetical protein [Streptomyces enissocaesilis]|uniref:Uncharacterized protein n=1 Tax=Streptomyces enissocaesilis TaxID=332589 RepID=A0ABP6K365_9ACTN